MGIKIVTANGQEVQSFEDWKNGESSSGAGQQTSGYSGPQIVNSSGQAVQSFEDWRRQRQGNADMFSSGSKIQRNQPASKADSLQNQWLKKYQGKGYNSLAASLLEMEDGEEKKWLTSYAAQVDYDEKRNLDTSAYEKAIRDLERQAAEYPDYDWTDVNQRRKASADLDTLQKEIDQRKQYLTQAKQIQEQAASEDKYKQVTSRKDFSQKSGFDSDNQEIGYQYVNADASGRSDLEQKYGRYATQFADIGIDSMNDEERSIYNYYMNSGDREEAARYLQYLEETLQLRKGTEADAAMDALTEETPAAKALRYAFMANVGYDQHLAGMRGAGDMIAGKDGYVPPSATQVAGQLVREDLAQDGKQLPKWLGGGSVGQMVGDLISTTANMAPSMAVGLVNPGAGAAMMGASAAGSAYQEKLNEGYSKDQARKYGIAVGASETALGTALSGIKTLGGAVTNNVIENALKGVKSGLGRFVVEWGSRIGSEALEEGVQTILEPLFSKWLLNTDEAVDWGEVAYSALLGGLSAGVLEGPSTIANARNATVAPNNATELAKNATADKMAAVDDKLSATEAVAKNATTTVGVSKMETVQVKPDMDSFAQQFGTQAEAVKRNYLEGQDLQEYEVGFQAAFAIGKEGGKAEALTEQNVPYLTRSQREIAFSMGRDAAMAEKAAVPEKKSFASAKMISDGADAKSVNVEKIVSMDNDTMTFQLDDGRTATDDDLDFANGQQLLSAVWELDMDAETANTILQESVNTSATDADLAAGIQEAHHYGQQGYTMDQLTKHGTDAAVLTDGQRKAAWETGRKIYLQRANTPSAAVKAPKASGVWFDAGEGNVVAFDEYDVSGVSEAAVAGARAAQVLQKLGIGRNYYFFESYVNRDGERVYKDQDGVERKAPNGWYDPSDGSIHIDLNAGSDANGLTLYTLSHELTHYVEKWSPKKYQALADFLVSNYAKAGNVDAMVAEKQAQLSESRGSAVSYEEAYSEFIADSMEAMLADGNVLEKLQELKKTDRSLFDKIREFFGNLAKKIREIYKDLTPDSLEGQAVLQMKDQIEQIQQLFADALAEASENLQAASDNDPAVAGQDMSNEEAFLHSETAVHYQIRPPYADGSKAFNAFVEDLNPEARKTFDLFYGFYQRSRITNTVSVSGKKVKAVNISSLYLLAQDWNDMIAKEPKWAAAAKELADFLPADVRKRMNMNEDGTLIPTTMEKEFKMPSSMAQRLVDALPYESIDARYTMGDKTVTLPEGKARQSVGGEAYRRAIIAETRKLFAEGKLKPVSIGTMSKDRWGSLGFLAANGKTGASGDFTTVCPQMMFNRGCWYCYRRAAMEKGVNNKLVANNVWYTGEILRIKDSDIDALNRNGGLRIQSFGDWMPHFSAMLADVLYDAEQRGLQVKIITKEPSMISYIAALRNQDVGKNLYFNLSSDYTIERGPARQAQGGDSLDAVNPERPFMRDQDNSFWWKRAMSVEEAAKYREKYPWVNSRIVATDVEEFIRGLKDSRVDVVTGYHGNIRGIERIDSSTGQRKIEVEALGDAGMPRFAFNPVTGSWVTEYEGKTATHKRLAQAIADNGLQMEYYTKTCCITGRCATCNGKCGALARDFNVKNATNRDAESIAYWQEQMEYAEEPEFGDMTVDSGNRMYSDRQNQDRSAGTSNRALLAGAFEDLARSPAEMEFLQKYQENIGLLNEQEAKLQEIRTEIRELTFGKGPKDPKRLEQLQEEAGKTANRIHIYDKKLLQLEAAKPLRDVLDREREKVRKATRRKGQEAMAEYREKRKESAARKDAKRKIRKTVMELDKLLNRGDKKKNVKSGMTSMVDSVLKLADALFMDEYTNRDMLRNGVGVELTDAEEKLFREAQQILQQAESGAAIEGMEFTSEVDAMNQLKKLDQKLSNKMAGLKDVFARERKRLYGTTVSDLLGKLADEYSRLSEAEDGAVRAAKDENVYAHLLQLQKDVGGTTVRDMTLNQMEAVADAFTMVLTTVRNANKMFAKNLKFKRDTLAGMVMGEIGAAVKKVSKLIRPGKNAADTFSWNNLKPVYAFERLGSETLKTLYQNIRRGQDVWSRDMQEADDFRREQYRKHNRKAWNLEKQHSFEFESGKVELSLEQIMSLYAYSRREQALDHLLKGGFVFRGSTEVMVKEHGIQRRYLKKDATAYNLTADELLQVIDTLTKDQKAFVEEMQTYLSDVMGGKGNEISLQMYGIRSYGEKNYFPIRSAGQYMERAKEDSFRKEQGQISIVNSGFTKSTTPKANNPITLDGFMNVWAEHVNDMSMYHGFALPMEDFRRVYNYSSPNVEAGNSQSVNAAIENAFGKAATGYIDQLYKDLNGGAVSDNRESLSKKLVGLHKKAAVFASASVVVQQPTAIVRAFALIDPRHFIGPKVDRKRHKMLWEEVKKYAPVAFVKEMGYFDTGMGRSARDFLQAEEYSGIREKAKALFKDSDYRDEILGKAPALADELAWCSIWEAVKRETKAKNPGMDVRSDAFLKIAGDRFSEVIDKTQVYDSVLSRSANMRSKALHMNMLTSFLAEPTTSINMLEDALRKGDRQQLKRTVGAVYGSVLLNSLLVSLVYAARDDDEDETWWEKYLSSVAVEMMDGINPITYYPILRDIWSIGQGFDVERADMSLISDFSDTANKVVTAIAKVLRAEADEQQAAMGDLKDSLWGMADSVASLTGLPVKNIRRDISGAVNLYRTISADWAGRQTTALSLQDTVLADAMASIPIGNLLYSKNKREKLYDAIVAGDTAYAQRLKAGYDSEDSYHSAIKLALRDYDSRIWEAARAWNANDLETYMKLAREIIGEDRFIQDDVVLAIRAEASSMEEKDSGGSGQAKGYFTSEKLGVAMGQNNISMADIICEDLIDTKVANGKSRDEAEKSVESTARSQLKELYETGKITGAVAQKMLVRYGGYDQDYAVARVEEWKYETDHPELDGRITHSQYKRWEADGKSRGVSLDLFTEVAEYQYSGTSDSNRSQEEVAAYINRLPISSAQKDALWCCFWKKSTLYKAPWR